VIEVYVCDEKADGRPVYALIEINDGRVIPYKAPAYGQYGKEGFWSCTRRQLTYPGIVQFRLKVGNGVSGAIERP
jgi:hypothetical protein